MSETPVVNIVDAQKRYEAQITAFGATYEAQIDDQMGQLHNQFVVFIATSQLPLSRALLVLEMVRDEIIEQAKVKYLGGA